MTSISNSVVPVKCACGCGEITPIATRNRVELGHIKGEHVDFCPGHNRRRIPKDIKERECRKCGKVKLINAFYKTGKHRAPGSVCKRCANSRVKNWEDENRKKVRAIQRAAASRRRERMRLQVIEKYRGKCVECGERRADALEIDHVNNDGSIDRKKYSGSSRRSGSTMTWLRSLLNQPRRHDIQLLCGTCHLIKTRQAYREKRNVS